MGPRFTKLDDWLRWQESLHPKAIDLGLDRVVQVYRRLGLSAPAGKVITVAGTNGKGSCVAFLEKLYSAAGYHTGSYTSPHLLRYNERISVAGEHVEDQALIEAFEAVDRARGDITLTYFEFGTLAALYLFARQPLDVVILEVGMGGRLDATNIIDADIALVTAIGLDHQEWLGKTRGRIAREKAGIFRSGRTAVCGDRQPPASLEKCADQAGTKLLCLGRDFDYRVSESGWHWRGGGATISQLPMPAVRNRAQLENITSAIQAAVMIQTDLPFAFNHLEQALQRYSLAGRCQIVADSPEVWLDVAHNTQAVGALAETLSSMRPRPTHFVLGVLSDKDISGILTRLAPLAHQWYLAAPRCARATPLNVLKEIADTRLGSPVSCHESVAGAFACAMQQADQSDRIVVTGSFYTVAEVMAERYRKCL